MAYDETEQKELRREFEEAVNMSPSEIEDWLKTDESKKVGQKDGDGESKGHESGRLIVKIKRRNVSELEDPDYEQMKRVISYVHRHRAQGGPKDDVEHSRWRYSLMNWGHDPLKSG